MEETDWESYGTGNYEKCADCMVHCGYEPTAVTDTIRHPFKALKVLLKGIDTDAAMVSELTLENQRPAEFVFESVVQNAVSELSPVENASDQERGHAA